MPFEPYICVWCTLISASRTDGNIKLGDEVSKNIESLYPEGAENFLLLSNM